LCGNTAIGAAGCDARIELLGRLIPEKSRMVLNLAHDALFGDTPHMGYFLDAQTVF